MCVSAGEMPHLLHSSSRRVKQLLKQNQMRAGSRAVDRVAAAGGVALQAGVHGTEVRLASERNGASSSEETCGSRHLQHLQVKQAVRQAARRAKRRTFWRFFFFLMYHTVLKGLFFGFGGTSISSSWTDRRESLTQLREQQCRVARPIERVIDEWKWLGGLNPSREQERTHTEGSLRHRRKHAISRPTLESSELRSGKKER